MQFKSKSTLSFWKARFGRDGWFPCTVLAHQEAPRTELCGKENASSINWLKAVCSRVSSRSIRCILFSDRESRYRISGLNSAY